MADTELLNTSKQTFLFACRSHNFTITNPQLEQLEKYVELLLSRNKQLNLISRKDEQNIWTQHILHCTSLLFHRKFPPNANILDLGTGGGLPGIVFAIFNPELQFTLLDATRKKINAVKSMAGELGLKNVSTVWGRAEEIGKHPDHSGKFDIVVARAVASMEKLMMWGKPFLRRDVEIGENLPGFILRRSLVAFKGGEISEEIKRLVKSGTFTQYPDIIEIDTKEEKKIVVLSF